MENINVNTIFFLCVLYIISLDCNLTIAASEPITDISVIFDDSYNLNVTWKHPDIFNAPIKKYQISIVSLDPKENIVKHANYEEKLWNHYEVRS